MAADLNYDPYKTVGYYEQQVIEAQKQANGARLRGVVFLILGIALLIVNIAVSGYAILIWLWVIAIVVVIGGIAFIVSGPGMYKDEIAKSQENLLRRRAEPSQ